MKSDKKPFYKKWQVWAGVVAVLFIIGLFTPDDIEPEVVAEAEKPKEVEVAAVKTPEEIAAEKEAAARIAEITKANEAKAAETVPAERDAEIRKLVEKYSEKYTGSEIIEIKVNENLGANDGSYLVLAYMNFKRPNSAEKTRNFIAQYSEDLAANLAEEADVSDVVVFWEAPRFLEGKNAVKYTYKKADAGMILQDEFVALELQ